jgi:hypothetical protein
LALQAQLKHPLREDFANLDDEILQFRQLGAPAGPLWPPDAVGKVFGDAFDIGTDFFYFGAPLFEACHPWLLLEVVATG